jgi:DNA polymerase-3 subunit chi
MTEVEFHTGVADPLGFACRLLRKAARQGVRLQVTALPQRLGELDRALWVFEERDFVPHVRMPGAPTAVARRTPIWLLARQIEGQDEAATPKVLVNLGAEPPHDLAALQRLIEIVGADAEEAAGGRERWRHYKVHGLQIKHHGGAEAARG